MSRAGFSMTPEQFVAVITALAIMVAAVTRLLFQVESMLAEQRALRAQTNGLTAQIVAATAAKAHAEGVAFGQANPPVTPPTTEKAPQ